MLDLTLHYIPTWEACTDSRQNAVQGLTASQDGWVWQFGSSAEMKRPQDC